jgi:redox-sensing transcriptional repressor
MEAVIPIKTIERLSLYRRIIKTQLDMGNKYIFSYNLAELANRKPSQVRKDLSFLSITSSSKGYNIKDLINEISGILDSSEIQRMALVGIGNMGKALINFFKGRGRNLKISAAFDIDNEKINRVFNGCRCYHVDRFGEVVSTRNISIGIITVPENTAQDVCDLMTDSGIKAIVNIAPVPLKAPDNIYIENLDFTMFFEKTAYYSKSN